MSAQHTPGPWIAASAPSSVVGWPVVASSGRSIASVAWSPNHWDAPPEEYAAFVAECEANSKLIGAAPDLLAAAEYQEHIQSPAFKGDPEKAIAKVRQMRRAAMAKARGEAE